LGHLMTFATKREASRLMEDGRQTVAPLSHPIR